MSKPIEFHWLKVGQCRHPECMTQRGGRWKAIDFPALVGLLIHPSEGAMLFDTGYTPRFFEATQAFPERLYRWATPVCLPESEQLVHQLEAHGIAPTDVKHVFISHMHADHVAGLKDFPAARLHISRLELDDMRARSRFGAVRHGILRSLIPSDLDDRLDPVDQQARVDTGLRLRGLNDGFDLLGDGSIVAVPLPGHSAGQIGIVFNHQSDRRVFLVADACWSAAALENNQKPTWLASQIFADRKRYAETFDALREINKRGDVVLLPSHCETSYLDFNSGVDRATT